MQMENKLTNRPLLERLTQADIVCRDCGERYGLSSFHVAECFEYEAFRVEKFFCFP
jgi:hypothetical protein